MPKERQLS